MNALIRSRNLKFFVVPETSSGVLVAPAASNALDLVEAPTYSQKGKYSDTSRVRNSRTAIAQSFDGMEFGTLSFKCPAMLKAAGTAPQEGNVLIGVFGNETLVASTSAEYAPAVKTGTYSVWILHDNQVLDALAGVKFSKLSATLTKEGELIYSVEAKFQRKYSAGTALLGSIAAATDTSITLDAAYDGRDLYFVGQKVDIIEAGVAVETGLIVSAVTQTTLTLTALSTGAAVGSEIRPSLPTPSTSGEALSMGNNQVFIAPVDSVYDSTDATGITVAANQMLCEEATFEISQEVMTPAEKEMTGTDFPTADYAEDARTVSGSIKLVLRRDDAHYAESLRRDGNRALVFRIQNTGGATEDIVIRSAKLETPEESESSGGLSLSINYKAFEGVAGTEQEVQLFTR